ncbi:MAG: 4-hydroxy-tetrahydrodipicolinate synthase [Acidobacteriia bacterium]|nr:4-hydroxy-tetrahydrodipicolinate synthase [Terriglobia bacterium]
MSEAEAIKGCGTALVTPFRPDLSLDRETLISLVSWQIQEGIDFLVSCATTGESATLTHEEILEVVRITVKTAAGRLPIVAGAGSNNTAHVIEMVRELEREGADAILSVSPYYNKPTQEGIYQHFRAVAQSTRMPVIIYNVPGRTGSNILPETLLRLAEIPNIYGVKEASNDISQIGDVCTRVPPGFRVFSGDDALTLPVIALGGHGVISVAGNEVPGMMAKFCHACLEGRWDEARAWNRKLYPLMKVNFIESNPIPVKAALALMGKISEVYRLPLVKMGDEARARLAGTLLDLQLVTK